MKKPTVLVIEDNLTNMKLMKSLLGLHGINVLEARDAEQGILIASIYSPDLILMDIQLPGMDGLAATRLLKQDSVLRETPIIALTSHAMCGDEEKAYAAGCDDYITKPINTRTFFSKLSGFLNFQNSASTTDHKLSDSHRPGKDVFFKGRVLVVDDEPKNVKLMSAILKTAKFDPVEAIDGPSALEIARKEMIDLVLLDLMMPGMSGHEVLKELKKDPKTKYIPVIIVSALSSNDDKVEGLLTGADEYLTKPVNKTELIARVNSILKLRQYQEQLKSRVESAEHFSEFNNDELVSRLSRTGGARHVLLVEDGDKDVKWFLSILPVDTFKITVVGSGGEAIKVLQKEKIDLVLLDLLLPDMDGYAVCEVIKKMEKIMQPQIVMVTCVSDVESKLRGLDAGVDDYIVKPIDAREIRLRMKLLLKKKEYLEHLYECNQKALGLAIIDPLTGLFNQSYFMHYLELEIDKSIHQRRLLGLLLFDLDNFKKYNDTYGHPVGDRILKAVARLVKESIRPVDLCARYGGEEFAIVMPCIEVEEALGMAESLRIAVSMEALGIEGQEDVPAITASFGLGFCPVNGTSVVELIQKADESLYRAKNSGKNRVCWDIGGGTKPQVV